MRKAKSQTEKKNLCTSRSDIAHKYTMQDMKIGSEEKQKSMSAKWAQVKAIHYDWDYVHERKIGSLVSAHVGVGASPSSRSSSGPSS